MAAAALAPMAAFNVEAELAKVAASVGHEFAAWARQPFYSDIRTTTRSWVEVDKNGKPHALVETKTKGFSISNGTILGVLVLVVGWEVALSFTKALSGWFGGDVSKAGISTAIELLAAPTIIYYDAAGAVVGFAKQTYDAVTAGYTAAYDWLDGKGPTQSSPPPKAAKTAAMPTTAGTALSSLLRGVVAPLDAGANQVSGKLVSLLQNASK